MKKMLLAFAVVACAAVAQAITFNWTSTSNDWYENGNWTCTLIHSTADAVSFDTAAQVLAGLTTDANYNVVASAESTAETQSVFNMDAKYDQGWISTPANYSATDTGTYLLVFTQDSTYWAAAVEAKDATIAWTETAGGAPNEGYANMGTFTTGTVVPEPTALALLALGVAGLALRRRA